MGLIKTLRNIKKGIISAIPLLPNYTQTQYVDDNLPALESKNLNKAEKQLVTLTNQINANIGTLNTLIATSNINVDKLKKLNSNGDFSQSLSMNNQKIYNLGTPTNTNDAVNKSYNDTNSFKKSGYNAGGSRIQNVGTPINDTDAPTKKYVDDNAGTTPVRETMYNTTFTLSHNEYRDIYNTLLNEENGKFKNIQGQFSPSIGNKWVINFSIIDWTSIWRAFYQFGMNFNDTSKITFIEIDKTLKNIYLGNETGVSQQFKLIVTGERI